MDPSTEEHETKRLKNVSWHTLDLGILRIIQHSSAYQNPPNGAVLTIVSINLSKHAVAQLSINHFEDEKVNSGMSGHCS